MAQQAVVTDYFTRKRQRDTLQASKRKRTAPTTQTELKVVKPVVVESETKKRTRETRTAKTPTRVTRATTRKSKKATNKTLDEYLSPKQDSTVNEKPPVKETITIKTTATCKPTNPLSPSKRSLNNSEEDPGKKRGRASPKGKEQNDSDLAQSNPTVTLNDKPSKLTRNARKRLVLKDNKDGSKTSEPTSTSNVDTTNVEDKTSDTVNNNTSTRSLRSRGKHGDVTNAVNIAEKLLAKKKESKETIQDSLKSKSNLKDLQETLLKMRDAKKKAKATKLAKSKAEKDAKKPEEVIKTVKKKDYAYSRFHTLAQEIPKGLSLPFKYKILQEMFRSADTVVGMLFNRQETATWMKVQHSVKDMINRNFEKNDLGQIKHVFPEAYLYRQEKGIPTYSDHLKSSDYQLTLEPILDSEELELLENQPKKLTSGMLVRRRHHFHLQLLEIVKNHHQAFLSSLEPAVAVDNNKLRRWHPQFQVDQVSDIPIADLPLPPDHDQKKCYSAKEVLDKAKDRLTKKAVDALKKVAEKCVKTPDKSKDGSIEENNNVTPVKKTPPKPAIKGVSKSLLDKIREKEADKKFRLMMRSDEDDQRLDKLRQLPDVAKALRMLFITEKKGALPLEYVAFKLVTACPAVCTSATSESYLRLMAKEADLLMSIANIRKQEYVKLDKNVQLNDVVAQINNKIKIAERS